MSSGWVEFGPSRISTLGKQAGDRYQSAGDLAADLERFLHTYAPVFTASKVAGLIRQVIGEQAQVPAA
ncbi:MAG TPA: hypothetical protein VN253_00950, partial [Kofleriaceae bacterium]|nr:hypothetical protein [Kofleriaceae bacterium]